MKRRTVKKLSGKAFCCVLLIALCGIVSAASDFPAPYDPHVNDFAGIFSASEIADMQSVLAHIYEETGAEIVVVTVNTTEPYTPQEYRTELFEEWGVGNEEKDTGLLIVYAVTEQRIEVEAGYGLEGILPDSRIGRILDESYVPLRDAGEVSAGIVLATVELAAVVEENAEEVRSATPRNSSVNMIYIIVFIAVLVTVFIIFSRAQRRYGMPIPIFVPFPGGGFGGGGFGGFGGGSSGGGGAGR